VRAAAERPGRPPGGGSGAMQCSFRNVAAKGAFPRHPTAALMMLAVCASQVLRVKAAASTLRALEAGGAGPLEASGSGGLLQVEGTGTASAAASLAAREERVEALESAAQQALAAQQAALEAVVTQQEALATQQAALQERQAQAERELNGIHGLVMLERLFGGEASSGYAPAPASVGVVAPAPAPLAAPSPAVAPVAALPPPAEKSSWKAPGWKEQLLSISVYLVMIVAVAFIYGRYFTYAYPTLRQAPNIARDRFSFGIFDGCRCDPDWRICFCSWFCMPVRWADTASSPKINFVRNFWLGVVVFALLASLSELTYGLTGLLLLGLAVANRQRVRQVYELPSGNCATACEDCVMWTFCGPCAVMQEALEVEFVEPPLEPLNP